MCSTCQPQKQWQIWVLCIFGVCQLTCISVWHMSNLPPAQSCCSPSAGTWGQSGRCGTEWCCNGRCFQLCAGVWGRVCKDKINSYDATDTVRKKKHEKANYGLHLFKGLKFHTVSCSGAAGMCGHNAKRDRPDLCVSTVTVDKLLQCLWRLSLSVLLPAQNIINMSDSLSHLCCSSGGS